MSRTESDEHFVRDLIHPSNGTRIFYRKNFTKSRAVILQTDQIDLLLIVEIHVRE